MRINARNIAYLLLYAVFSFEHHKHVQNCNLKYSKPQELGCT